MLTGERIREAFKEYLVTGDITKEMNYTIFFAVNEKLLKYESVEHRYKEEPNGDWLCI